MARALREPLRHQADAVTETISRRWRGRPKFDFHTEFNSIPSIRALVPNGYEGMKLAVDLAVPEAYHEHIDVDAVEAVFPYGEVVYNCSPAARSSPRASRSRPWAIKETRSSSRCAA